MESSVASGPAGPDWIEGDSDVVYSASYIGKRDTHRLINLSAMTRFSNNEQVFFAVGARNLQATGGRWTVSETRVLRRDSVHFRTPMQLRLRYDLGHVPDHWAIVAQCSPQPVEKVPADFNLEFPAFVTMLRSVFCFSNGIG